MHQLLRRQIKRFLGASEAVSQEMTAFFDAINASYQQADTDRLMLERSLEIVSQEMLEQNRALSNELRIRQEAELQLDHLANFDALTGLVNRSLLRDRIKQALVSANRRSQGVAIVVLGLDGFKLVNETLGLDVGNELLKVVTERLRASVREVDTIARSGGDEFCLVLAEESGTELTRQIQSSADQSTSFALKIIEVLQRILVTVSEPIMLNGKAVHVTCSIGASFYPQDGDSVDTLIQHSDAAMTSAKRQGRNNVQLYTSDLSDGIHERLALQVDLRTALRNEELILHYQPQVNLRTGQIVGMEALIRWNHPQHGLIYPSRFINLAEETGLILPIGSWVIRTAAYQSLAWKKAGHGDIRVALNLSAREFSQPNIVEYVAEILTETGLSPKLLEIEITESMVMGNIHQAIEKMCRLKELGVLLSIDDFGTGYSSLSYLKRFPIDVLKIDQSFVRDMQYNTSDQAIVKAIISMSHSLGIAVVAEGVETEQQCAFLSANLCDEMQGYLFSKAVPQEEAALLLSKKQRLDEHLLHRRYAFAAR